MTGRRVSPALRDTVRSAPAFRAFAAVLGERIQRGASLDALRMLAEIGASATIGNDIIEGWPRRGQPHDLDQAGMKHGEIAALWLACHIGEVSSYDWNKLLTRAALVADAQRASDRWDESGIASGDAGDKVDR